MKVLAIDTSVKIGSVAIFIDGHVKSVVCSDGTRSDHAETILGLIDSALHQTKLELADINGIAVGIGPGSFTGLRIGLATAKGLVMAKGLPLVGVSSLEATAIAFASVQPEVRGKIVCAKVPIKRDELFAAAFRVAKDGTSIDEIKLSEKLTTEAELLNDLKSSALKDAIIAEAAPLAVGVGILGAKKIASGSVLPLAMLVPNYIRRSDAELKHA